MDFDPEKPFPLGDALAEAGIESVLVVAGDPPQDMARRIYATRPVELIERIRRDAPELRVYAAVDPYRCGPQEELEGVRAKLGAGAHGLFSQPFFDVRLLDVWADLLGGHEVWWGVTPVLSAAARRYWEAKNRAVFPPDSAATLDWNRRLAARSLAWARERDANLYFMPIRADLAAWLGGIL
jgi:methylenetetrahydrofolate reductase (NADPH)